MSHDVRSLWPLWELAMRDPTIGITLASKPDVRCLFPRGIADIAVPQSYCSPHKNINGSKAGICTLLGRLDTLHTFSPLLLAFAALDTAVSSHHSQP